MAKKGRKTSLTSSQYVKGAIDVKARGRWVDAVSEIEHMQTFAKGLDDAELGLTTAACGKMKTNVANALERVNQEGSSKGWNNRRSHDKKTITAQKRIITDFLSVLEAECDQREHTPAVITEPLGPLEDRAAAGIVSGEITPTGPCHAVDIPEPVEESIPAEVCEPETPNLFELFADTPQRELLELAYAGLEANKSCVSPEELENLRQDLKVTIELREELKKDAERRRDLVEELRGDKKRLTLRNKKLFSVLNGIHTEDQNRANRLHKLLHKEDA